jgi:hypothetical protein
MIKSCLVYLFFWKQRDGEDLKKDKHSLWQIFTGSPNKGGLLLPNKVLILTI